jgi:glycerol-3-phosphate dehydrogenase
VSSAPARWSAADRHADWQAAERAELDLIVIGGGITGAGVLRDAASRGLRAVLLERDDFASGTSGRSSKLVHGGLRYIGEGQLGTTREACRERDRLVRLNPSLVRPYPFLFPAYDDSKVPLWQVRAALGVYATLANFRRSARFRMLAPEATREWSRDLRTTGLRGAGLFWDAHVDDARLVLETLRSARSLGGIAISRAEVIDVLADEDRVVGVLARDAGSGREIALRAPVVVNAAGPAVERVQSLRRPDVPCELRPAKGVHLVVPRARLALEAAVTLEGPDGRSAFAAPWGDVVIVGTTDEFSEEIDEPIVTIEEVHYLLRAANHAFPDASLTTNDLTSAYAGVRPLAADPSAKTPSTSVSREDRIRADPGFLSVMGGKLTTYRAMAERIVDRAVAQLARERRRELTRSQTRSLPLRDESFDASVLEAELVERFALAPARATHLVTHYGLAAPELLSQAPPEWRRSIGGSRFLLAEISWAFETECPETLCDLLERRMRMAIYAVGQGLPQLTEIAQVAALAAGWDEERTRAEAREYAAAVRRRYQIAASSAARDAA